MAKVIIFLNQNHLWLRTIIFKNLVFVVLKTKVPFQKKHFTITYKLLIIYKVSYSISI